MLKLYAESLRRIPKGLAKSPWVVVLPMLYGVVANLIGGVVAPLGIVGGIIMGLVWTALAASFLYLVAELVDGNGVRMEELPNSWRPYFWPVMNVGFIVWIASMLVGPLLGHVSPGVTLGLFAVLFVLLNATPEVIYLRRSYGGMDILQGSFHFIQENWIEWFIPNILFGALYFFGLPYAHALLPRSLGPLYEVVSGVIDGALLLPIFIFRGHLFRGLDGSSRRARAWAGRQ
jgi:hypothetical protein